MIIRARIKLKIINKVTTMKEYHNIFKTLIVFFFALFSLQAFSAEQLANLDDLNLNDNQAMPLLTPSPPSIEAKSYILVDANSGKVLAEKNAGEQLPPASLTKVMTAYLISESLKHDQINIDDNVRISTKAWQTEGSRMFVEAGEEVPVSDLIQGIIVQSGNDASVAMAEYIAGNEDAFAELMNQQALYLGMNDTHFVNSTGLPAEGHLTSARDLALLSRALILNHPDDYQWHKEKSFTYNGIKQSNRNRLLWIDPSVDGIKTGHTEAAGFCLVTSAQRDGMRLIAVIMDAPSDQARTEDNERLLTYGFRFFETQQLYQGEQAIAERKVWQGEGDTLRMGVSNNLYVTFPKGQSQNLDIDFDLADVIKAPIEKGEQIGKINITLNDDIIATQPLIALDDITIGSYWTQMSDSIALSIKGWFN